MKFRCFGGLDSPDWILAEIAEFTKVDSTNFHSWCQLITNRLKSKRKEWNEDELENLREKSPEFDINGLKGALAALAFILEKSAKNLCLADDLEQEMLQLGMSSGFLEHAKQLHSIYEAENEELSQILRASFIREPSLTLSNHETQIINNLTVHKLECKTSDGKPLNLAMSDEKYQIFKSELKRALDSLEPYCNK